MFKRLFPIIFALILLGAHFSRNNNDILAIICVLLPFLLFIKRMWVIYLLQTIAYLGGVIWAYTTYSLVVGRLSEGQPWLRLLIILAVVALFTIWSAYWVKSPAVKEKYK